MNQISISNIVLYKTKAKSLCLCVCHTHTYRISSLFSFIETLHIISIFSIQKFIFGLAASPRRSLQNHIFLQKKLTQKRNLELRDTHSKNVAMRVRKRWSLKTSKQK